MCGYKWSTRKPFWILGPKFGPEIRKHQKRQWFKPDWVANKKEHSRLLGIFLGRAFCFWQPLVESLWLRLWNSKEIGDVSSKKKKRVSWYSDFLKASPSEVVGKPVDMFFCYSRFEFRGWYVDAAKKESQNPFRRSFLEKFWISISQVSDYKDEIDRLNRELQEVKKKFYDQKKREMIQQDLLFGQEIFLGIFFLCTVWVLVVKKKNDLGMRMRKTWINGPQVQQPPVEMRRYPIKIQACLLGTFCHQFFSNSPDKTIKTPAIFEVGTWKRGWVDLSSFLPTLKNHNYCEQVGTLNKTNSSFLKKHQQKPWLRDDPFLFGARPIFRGEVRGV